MGGFCLAEILGFGTRIGNPFFTCNWDFSLEWRGFVVFGCAFWVSGCLGGWFWVGVGLLCVCFWVCVYYLCGAVAWVAMSFERCAGMWWVCKVCLSCGWVLSVGGCLVVGVWCQTRCIEGWGVCAMGATGG